MSFSSDMRCTKEGGEKTLSRDWVAVSEEYATSYGLICPNELCVLHSSL